MSTGPDDAAIERHRRIKQIFMAALDAPRGRRAAFVAAACEGDEVLRREILELFLVHGEEDSVLGEPLDGRVAFEELGRPRDGQVGPYRLLGELGRGGMGVVYLAELEGKQVALKLLAAGSMSPELRARFRLEAEIMRRLDHPSLARVLDVGEDMGPAGLSQPWIALEHVSGPPLLRFAEEHALSAEARLRLLVAVCDAVQHAHARGIVHRDLKPGNILVRSDDRPVVLDFGVARLLAGDERPTELATRTGQLVGTPQYMSPEQVQAEPAGVGPESDVYSLGVILYELLTGRVPYEASSVSFHRAIVSILTAEPRPLGELERSLRGPTERIVSKALEKDPRHRYPDAGSLADDLRRRLEGHSVRARGPGLARRMMRWSRRRQRLTAVLAALGIAAALLVAWGLGSKRTVPRERIRAVYREAEALISEATPLLYERERTAATMRQVVDMLTRARERIGEVPPLSHRDILVRRLEKDLGTTQMLLGEFTWDVGYARQAEVSLEHALATPYDTVASHARDLQVAQLGDRRVPPEEIIGLLASAHLGVYRLWGEGGPLASAMHDAKASLAENRRLEDVPLGPPSIEVQSRGNLLGYCFNSLAEIGTERARFRASEEAARQAAAWSDSAYQRRAAFALDWTALGSLLFERSRAYLALGELTASSAMLDTAGTYLRACLDYRGPERPRIHSETLELSARLALARSGVESAPEKQVELLFRSLRDLETAHRMLARTAATPAQLAWLRASQSEPFAALARVTRSSAWLDSAQSRLDETTEAFPPTSLPRHASIHWMRLGVVKLARRALGGSPLALASARRDFANARALAQGRRDSLVLALVEREERRLAR